MTGEHRLPTSAYIHVPFCLHRCGYCDFTVIAGRDDLIGEYLHCLEMELQSRLVEPHPMKTVFIGGGTPSYLSAVELHQLFELLKKWLPLDGDADFTIECNPERFTLDRMAAMREGGINRVSLGVQSFFAEHLQTLERSHTAETVETVIRQLREFGFENISLDLIFGVPGQTRDEWQRTLEAAITLSPQHISTYGLTYEKGTAFWTRKSKNLLQPVTEELEREMYADSMSRLPNAGYRQYELSNFAIPGFESRHNQVYWRAEPYFGIGPGAASFLQGVRTLNHRSVTTWLKRIRCGESAILEREEFDAELRAREAVMLGFRQLNGIEQSAFAARYGATVRELSPEAYDHFLKMNWIEETATHVRLTREGSFVADSVMAEFL
ncbi:radical SAM family heme chaperone HemW [Planctomicrobium sp. SH668]|uniref:radical SAM family heme chaperone HemW n=1 Tax=Planctomicrobium sp. SH668 TaxID=3448126 RepID=UPI003F5B2DFE